MRTGFIQFAGYLVGGMKAWDNAGFGIEETNQITVHDLAKTNGTAQIIDVRSPSEWKEGHIPGAQHIFLPELSKELKSIDRKKPKVIYCDSGYRASLAARRAGRWGLGVRLTTTTQRLIRSAPRRSRGLWP